MGTYISKLYHFHQEFQEVYVGVARLYLTMVKSKCWIDLTRSLHVYMEVLETHQKEYRGTGVSSEIILKYRVQA